MKAKEIEEFAERFVSESKQPMIDSWMLIHAINRKIQQSTKPLAATEQAKLGSANSESIEVDSEPRRLDN